MNGLKLRVAAATLACFSTQAAVAQDAGNGGTQAPPPQQGAPLPEVQVIQQPKTKPKVKKAAHKAKKPAPQPQPVEAAAPPPSPEEAVQAAAGQGPIYANPAPPAGIQVAPLPGADLPIDKIPRTVNTLSSADIQRDHSVNMQDTLNNRIPGVVVDDLQGNAFQTGVQYRGFEASPVNGLPQGLAVYQNGVRINEAFGDTVNWDFIPAIAIQDMTVMSSNPIFGLNAIGGSISIAMKDGFSFQGADVDTRFGSFGRKQVSAEAGAQSGHWAVYGAFEAINDDGFRDFSDAQERRGYADIGVKGDGTELHFNTTIASSHVGVTAAVPEELIDFAGRTRTFTSPQITQSDMQMYSLNGSTKVTPDITLSGVTYYRHFKQSHIDGNISEFDDCNPTIQGLTGTELCTEDGAPLFAAGSLAPLTNLDQYGDVLGSIDKTGQNTDGWGVALQAADKADLFGHRNQFIIGTSYDRGHVAYQASSQLGGFLPRYVVDGTGPTLTGNGSFPECDDDQPDVPCNASDVTPRSLTTTNDYVGVYALDAFDVTDRLTVTAGGRFNYASIQITNTGESSLDALNGTNQYSRFNPSAGFTYKINPDMSFYGGYSEANRAATASEIACSDPENPCIIESALASDPHLDQVVTKTWELGLRGTQNYWNGSRIDWNVGWFRALNSDDIIQIADQQQGRGYFANAGDTLRQGVDASIQYRDQRLFAYASYSYVDATFQSTNVIPSENNPKVTTECSDFGINAEDDDELCMQIRPGDRLPGVPRHRFKAGFDYKLTPKWIFGADLIAASNQIFYGDEANLDRPLQGYTKVNLHTSYNITDNVQVYGLIENLFDNQYGIYGTYFNTELAQEAGPGKGGSGGPDKSLKGLVYDPDNARTTTPAIPFAAYGGIKVRF
jgi:outer membrane receptor protein involved in Fe transport